MPKKKLLVVAPGLPEFDRNAGSRRLYSWLRILAAEYDIAFYMLQRRIRGDSTRIPVFDGNYTMPAVERAWREARGELKPN